MPTIPGPGGSGKGTGQSAQKAVQGSPGVGGLFSGVVKDVNGWLAGLGGQIGSGIESALVSGLVDLFDVVIGPLEIAIGFLFILWAFMFFFKDDIMNFIRILGGMAISRAVAA